MHKSNSLQSANAFAVGLSSLCLVHCLALPAILSFAPILGLASNEWVHKALVLLAVPTSLFVLSQSKTGLDRAIMAALVGSGITLLVSGAFVEALHDYETALTVLGAVTLATTHAYRWWRHKALAYPPEEHL